MKSERFSDLNKFFDSSVVDPLKKEASPEGLVRQRQEVKKEEAKKQVKE